MDWTYEHHVNWTSSQPNASYFVAHLRVEEDSRWRIWDRIDTLRRNITYWWQESLLVSAHDGHLLTSASSGGRNAWPVCAGAPTGPILHGCDPVTVREALGGAYAGTLEAGEHIFYAVVYGGVETRNLELKIDSDVPVQILEAQAGQSELIILDEGSPGIEYTGNATYVHSAYSYRAETQIYGKFSGLRGMYDNYTAAHESGLKFHFEHGPTTAQGSWHIDGEAVQIPAFTGPAGNWTFTARGERDAGRASSPAIGLLLDPFFVRPDGSMIPLP